MEVSVIQPDIRVMIGDSITVDGGYLYISERWARKARLGDHVYFGSVHYQVVEAHPIVVRATGDESMAIGLARV